MTKVCFSLYPRAHILNSYTGSKGVKEFKKQTKPAVTQLKYLSSQWLFALATPSLSAAD